MLKIILFFLGLFPAYSSVQNQKIAIIGAGISGISAAYYLKKQGYENVTIFEKENRLGGKILSREFDGPLYELGAVWVFKDYKEIIKLAQEYKVPLTRFSAKKTILDENGIRYSFLTYGIKKYDPFEILLDVWKLKSILKKYSGLNKPGLSNIPEELYDTFDNFIKKNKLESLAYIVEPFIIGCGYGYFKDVPAIYYIKPTLLILDSLLANILDEKDSSAFQFFPGGFQNFLEKISFGQKINLEEEVLGLNRYKKENGYEIQVRTTKGSYTFDRVIISTPPDDTLKYLDYTEEEYSFFSQMKSNYYQITALSAQGLPQNEVMFLDKASNKQNRGTPAVLANWGDHNHIWIALSPFDNKSGKIPWDILLNKIQGELESLNGTLENILFTKGINYFFHFEEADLVKKPYEKFESLQGRLGTYFVGGYLNFEGVEHSTQYSKNIILKYFSKLNP